MTNPHAMLEDELLRKVRAMCEERGLLVNHVEDARLGRVWQRGMPDLEIFGRVNVHAELKREDDDLSPDQKRIRHAIIRGGGRFYIWKPSHLLDGTIARELDKIS
jgi:hypothetical protein